MNNSKALDNQARLEKYRMVQLAFYKIFIYKSVHLPFDVKDHHNAFNNPSDSFFMQIYKSMLLPKYQFLHANKCIII